MVFSKKAVTFLVLSPILIAVIPILFAVGVVYHFSQTFNLRMSIRYCINWIRETIQKVKAVSKAITLSIEEILNSIRFSYERTVVARYPHHKVSYDTLFGSISKYGQVQYVLSHWLPKTHECALPEEGGLFRKRNGLIIKYQRPEMASKAARYLPRDIGSGCRVLSLEALIEKIAVEEAIVSWHPTPGTVLVGRDIPLSERDGIDLRRYFGEIANIVSMTSRPLERGNGCEFVVTYRFVTHAILAIYLLDGKKYINGILTVCLQNTKLASKIVKCMSKKEKKIARNIF